MAEKSKQEKLTIRVPSELKKELEALADEELRSVNSQTVVILKEGLAQHKAVAIA